MPPKTDAKAPSGKVSEFKEEGEIDILMYLENPQEKEGGRTVCKYTSDFIAAALMLFCRGEGIPLPKNAKKSVMIKGEDVMLRVQK